MKVVIAIDSFKGSVSSLEAGNAIKEGILKAEAACKSSKPTAEGNEGTARVELGATTEVMISPIADGGEGTVEALVKGMKGELMTSQVTGPLGGQVSAAWGMIDDGETKTAVIEMAEAAGIVLLERKERNPLKTTTFGVGELIKAAINEGCRRFIVGIGGSATNDGGVGMLKALGFEFLDAFDQPIENGAIGLKNLKSIDAGNVLPELKECTFRVACDVKNPLCGDNGCSAIYGPQKGATPDMIKDMDEWLGNYGRLSKGDMDYPGTGAAGGMGFAFRTFLRGTLEPGIDIALEETGLEEMIKNADIIVTGEGRMDAQTVMGKAPVGVASIAKKYGKRVIAFCGCATEDADICNEYGIDAYFPILRSVCSLDEALDKKTALENLRKTSEQVFRVLGV